MVGPVDTARYQPATREARGEVVIGWIGSPSTSPYLATIEEPLARIHAHYPQVEVALVGANAGTPASTGASNTRWALDGELAALARFDIGIMPLPDDPVTRAKGGYRLLQYLSLGIPSVVAPVGVSQ